MKHCNKCNQTKGESEFSIRNKAKNTRQSWCLACFAQYHQEKYQTDEAYKAKVKISRDKMNTRYRNFMIEYLSEHPCVDCNESDIRCLEFDHLKDKEFTIELSGRRMGLERIKKEIQKCAVRCANCHRKKTAEENNTYRQRGYSVITARQSVELSERERNPLVPPIL